MGDLISRQAAIEALPSAQPKTCPYCGGNAIIDGMKEPWKGESKE